MYQQTTLRTEQKEYTFYKVKIGLSWIWSSLRGWPVEVSKLSLYRPPGNPFTSNNFDGTYIRNDHLLLSLAFLSTDIVQ